MNSRLDIVIENFREYLRSVKVSSIHDEIEVEYTLLSYDYIDDDLDFDEEYYAGLCSHFVKWMETTAVEMIKEREINVVRLVRNKMLFRNQDAHLETTTFRFKDEYISIERESRISLS